MPLRPLFEEPTADLERTDPSEGPLGFMLGGMASLSDEQIADQYFDAATLLADAIRSGERDDYQLAYPVLFLYRHSVELQLKSTVPNTGKIH